MKNRIKIIIACAAVIFATIIGLAGNMKVAENSSPIILETYYAGVSNHLGNILLEIPMVDASVIIENEKHEVGFSMQEMFETSAKRGWILEQATVKQTPSFDGVILDYMYFNEEVSYWDYDEKWAITLYNGKPAYIHKSNIVDKSCTYTIVEAPYNPNYKGNKTWMDYRTIKDPTTYQYKLKNMAYTGTYGVRMLYDRYLVAVGTGVCGKAGTYIDIVLENGTVIPCIIGDIKADIHTDATKQLLFRSDCRFGCIASGREVSRKYVVV